MKAHIYVVDGVQDVCLGETCRPCLKAREREQEAERAIVEDRATPVRLVKSIAALTERLGRGEVAS